MPPRANLSREEPDAGIPHVRVCEGWGRQRPHLLGDDPRPPNSSLRFRGRRPPALRCNDRTAAPGLGSSQTATKHACMQTWEHELSQPWSHALRPNRPRPLPVHDTPKNPLPCPPSLMQGFSIVTALAESNEGCVWIFQLRLAAFEPEIPPFLLKVINIVARRYDLGVIVGFGIKRRKHSRFRGMQRLHGVVCGRGRNPTLRNRPSIFSCEIDVFPS